MKTFELSDEDLVKKCAEWVDKLCKSGGSAWNLSVPVNFEKDPDILLSELIKRYSDVSAGVKCIATEREEQISKHGWSLEDDQSYSDEQLLKAALFCIDQKRFEWPFGWIAKFRDKVLLKNRIQQLAVAGALIAAEIDRLQMINDKNNNLKTKESCLYNDVL